MWVEEENEKSLIVFDHIKRCASHAMVNIVWKLHVVHIRTHLYTKIGTFAEK